MGASAEAARRVVGNGLPSVLGVAAGVAFVSTSPYRDAPQWPVWAAVWVALTGVAGAVFTFGLAHWRELPSGERLPLSATVIPVGVLIGGGLVAVRVPSLVGHDYGWRGTATVSVCLIGSAPAAATVFAVRRAAQSVTWPDGRSQGEQVVWLIERRRSLRALLSAVGSLVALSTLALGAASQVQKDLVAAGRLPAAMAETPGSVVIAGAASSLLIGSIYGLAAGALLRRGRALCAEVFDVAQASDAATLLDRAENRQKLEALTGADTGPFADLQAGLLVLAPLIASAASSFLPR